MFYYVLYTSKILKERSLGIGGCYTGHAKIHKANRTSGCWKGILPSRKLTLQLHQSAGAGGLGNKLDHRTKGRDWAEAPRTSWQGHCGPVPMCRSSVLQSCIITLIWIVSRVKNGIHSNSEEFAKCSSLETQLHSDCRS